MRLRKGLLALGLAGIAPWVRADAPTWAGALEARGVKVSAGIWEADTGRRLDGFHDATDLIPASTTKVVSTYALLKTLKPDFTLETEVWGDLKDGLVRGDLTFKGGGDPFLTSERLWLLAQALRDQGVARVAGQIRLDQGAFDAQREARGWENTTADSLPTVLALSVNFNRDDRGRPVREPEHQSRNTLKRILEAAGIVVEGKEAARNTEVPRRLLAWPSLPLRQLVQDINKWSNNFMVEMLVRQYGAGSWDRGVARIQAFYQGHFGLGPEIIRITDGSGLSKENRLSARTLAIILRAAYQDFEVGPEWVASLKVVGGEPWKQRVNELDAGRKLSRRVRVKTGHLDAVNAACGYLQAPDGKVWVFAILLNGPAREEDLWDQVSRWASELE